MKRCEAQNYQQKHLQQQNVTSQKLSLSRIYYDCNAHAVCISQIFIQITLCVYVYT